MHPILQPGDDGRQRLGVPVGRGQEPVRAFLPVGKAAAAQQAVERGGGVGQTGLLQLADERGGLPPPLRDLGVGLQLPRPRREFRRAPVEFDELGQLRSDDAAMEHVELSGKALQRPCQRARLSARFFLLAPEEERSDPLGALDDLGRGRLPEDVADPLGGVALGVFGSALEPLLERPRGLLQTFKHVGVRQVLPIAAEAVARRRALFALHAGVAAVGEFVLAAGEFVGKVAGHRQLVGDLAASLALDLSGDLVKHQGPGTCGVGPFLGAPPRERAGGFLGGLGGLGHPLLGQVGNLVQTLQPLVERPCVVGDLLLALHRFATVFRPVRRGRVLALGVGLGFLRIGRFLGRRRGVAALLAARGGLGGIAVHLEAAQGRINEVLFAGELFQFVGDGLGFLVLAFGLTDFLRLRPVERPRGAGRFTAAGDQNLERAADFDQVPQRLGHPVGGVVGPTPVERLDRREHGLLGLVERLDPLADDPFDPFGEIAHEADEHLLERGDLERVFGGRAIVRPAVGVPRGAAQVEPLAGDQLRERRGLAAVVVARLAVGRLILALEWADVEIPQVGLRPFRAAGMVVLGEGVIEDAVGRRRLQFFNEQHLFNRRGRGRLVVGAVGELLEEERLFLAVIEPEDDPGLREPEVVADADAVAHLGDGVDLKRLVGLVEADARRSVFVDVDPIAVLRHESAVGRPRVDPVMTTLDQRQRGDVCLALGCERQDERLRLWRALFRSDRRIGEDQCGLRGRCVERDAEGRDRSFNRLHVAPLHRARRDAGVSGRSQADLERLDGQGVANVDRVGRACHRPSDRAEGERLSDFLQSRDTGDGNPRRPRAVLQVHRGRRPGALGPVEGSRVQDHVASRAST